MSLCNSIDTLSMAFLDDELAGEDRRELELHLLDCASCRQQVDGERADLALVRKALVAPPAPALLKARVARALDAEDAAVARSKRRRWSAWALPGSAIAAAAAAILVFVGAGVTGEPNADGSAIADAAAKQQTRTLPLEVQGPTTRIFLQNNGYEEPPQFTEPGIALVGGRLLPNGIANHDAAMLRYQVTGGRDQQVTLTALLLKDLRSDELGGQVYQSNGAVFRVLTSRGLSTVGYIDPRTNVGYLFLAQMAPEDLLRLVVSTDLITRARQVR
jgi:anti-sigma factor RsiW